MPGPCKRPARSAATRVRVLFLVLPEHRPPYEGGERAVSGRRTLNSVALVIEVMSQA